jgi:hypothetical protein
MKTQALILGLLLVPSAFCADAANLALGKPVTVVSGTNDRAGQLVDGVMQKQGHNENFWASAPDNVLSVIAVDLGEEHGIDHLALQFRGISNKYVFVPESITIELSSDGTTYNKVLQSERLPKENSRYSPLPWEYEVARRGRFVRISLHGAQSERPGYKGIVELTELQVWNGKIPKPNCHIVISTRKTARRIKPLHGVNGGPRTYNLVLDTSKYFREAGFPFARLHDVEYPMGSGEFVDIHCVFPDFGADPGDPTAYNFASTDAYIKAIVDTGCEVFYRLGESIDHGPIRKYIRPPQDPRKWARVCEGIVRHYNEGWANGFRYNIRYWEIWNEPESKKMWTGTDEQFFQLYTVTANHLKTRFPGIKVGGYASCGFYGITRGGKNGRKQRFVAYLDRFLDHISSAEGKAPLDFFSWHIYSDRPEEAVEHAKYVAAILDERGFGTTESCLNEWNYGGHGFESMREMGAACYVAGMLCRLQDAPVDSAMYYDAQPRQRYGALFSPVYATSPSKAYYPMKAFGDLYRLGHQATSSCDDDDTYFCAATDGQDVAAMICNYGNRDADVTVRVDDLQPAKKVECYVLDETRNLRKVAEHKAHEFSIDLKCNTVILLKSR